MMSKNLMFNPGKMEVLLGGGWVGQLSDPDVDISPVLDGVSPPLKAQIHSLRMLLDCQLLLDNQVAVVAKSAYYQLRLIRHHLFWRRKFSPQYFIPL